MVASVVVVPATSGSSVELPLVVPWRRFERPSTGVQNFKHGPRRFASFSWLDGPALSVLGVLVIPRTRSYGVAVCRTCTFLCLLEHTALWHCCVRVRHSLMFTLLKKGDQQACWSSSALSISRPLLHQSLHAKQEELLATSSLRFLRHVHSLRHPAPHRWTNCQIHPTGKRPAAHRKCQLDRPARGTRS